MRWLALPAVVLSVALVASSQTTRQATSTSSPATSTAPTTLSLLKAKAEAVMKLDSVSKRPEVAAVFQYADALAQAGREKEAMQWYERGLGINAWAMASQLKYAQLLKKQGNEAMALERARLVAETAEQGDLVVAALKLMGKESEADETLPPLGKVPGTGPAIVLVAINDVDALLVKQVYKQLQSSFTACPIYLQKVEVDLPPPWREPYGQYLSKYRTALAQSSIGQNQLERQGLTLEDLKDDQKLINFAREMVKAQRQEMGLREFNAMLEQLKSAPKGDLYLQYLVKLRTGLKQNPDVAKLLEKQGLTIEDLDDQKLLALTREAVKANSQAIGLQQFDVMLAQMKSAGKQWSAFDLLKLVGEVAKPVAGPHVRFIGITRLDITQKDANYLFALQGGHFGIVSYRQFMTDNWGASAPKRSRLADRLAKQCTSSIGRVFGISACGDPSCVAAYPNSLAELDAKASEFCPACKKKMEETIAAEQKN